MMMPEVVLVNTSRGEIVHIPSLVEALGRFHSSFQSVQFFY
jgi:phosphoglycerate dehydrogenase-like enzyme